MKRKLQMFLKIFCKYSPEFRINTEPDFLNTTNISHNPVENTICKYENHPSVIPIKKHERYLLLIFLSNCHKR